MDEELLELCKEVYKRLPEWETKANYYMTIGGKSTIWHWQDAQEFDRSERFPLYTSDYLLEKLPRSIRYNNSDITLRVEVQWSGGWRAHYGMYDWKSAISDTPQKALLKLVIALDDAGQLVAEETTA